VASEFLDRMTRLALRGIMYAGFSFGIDDEDIPAAAAEQMKIPRARLARSQSSSSKPITPGSWNPCPDVHWMKLWR